MGNIIPIFKPKKVSADEVNRGGYIFSNSTISLLEANVNDWFLIAEYTGDDYKKIYQMKKEVEEKGYDTYMIYINTTLEVALQRNEKRDRVLPQKIVMDSHRAVMQNLGGFNGLFKQNFMVADNNKDLDEKKAAKRFSMLVKQGLNKFIKKPLKNPIGKSWIRKQKILKK